MSKKKPRNKARDMIGDYYQTNARAYRENQQANQEKPSKPGWSSSEKTLLALIVLGVIGVIIKYLVF